MNTKKIFSLLVTLSVLFFPNAFKSQNESKNWYFGINAGLSFTSNPPTVLTAGAMNAVEGCSSISDAGGNLLFYTDGSTVWNQLHLPMANGTGLLGNWSSTQGAVIVQQPGNAGLYYIFTVDAAGAGNGFRYSIVDMNLAAGMGSVTVKNTLLSSPTCEKIAAVRHCNGTDAWIVAHDFNSNNFRAYLITAAGVSNTPVLSPAGPTYTVIGDTPGQMKISPNGKKLALARYSPGKFELYDFNVSTGVVSNYQFIDNVPNAYGCEFSPDGRVLYGTSYTTDYILQWDLCAGSATAVAASQYTFVNGPGWVASLQLAPNGKIYVARVNQFHLDVISTPNNLGAACGYIPAGQPLSPQSSHHGLPTVLASRVQIPFTYTTSCLTTSFTASPNPTIAGSGCSASGASVSSTSWIFGDPASGTSNVSVLNNPSHVFSSAGTYTVKLVKQGTCFSDTTIMTVNTSSTTPQLNVTGNFSICSGESGTVAASGASNYTWSTGQGPGTITLSPANTSTYSVIATDSISHCKTVQLFTLTVFPCTSIHENGYTSFRVFPVPFGTTLNLNITNKCAFTLYSHSGVLVMKGDLEPGLNTVSTSGLLPGPYLLHINDANGLRSLKLIKE